MQFCAVYTNIKDDEMDVSFYLDLHRIFTYLTAVKNVGFIILNRSKAFDRLCEEIIADTKTLRFNEVKIINSPNVSTFDKLLDLQFSYDNDNIGNYLICDKTTKNTVRKKICVDHIIEIPDSDLCIVSSATLW